MSSPDAGFLKEAEAFLVDARKYSGELADRKALIQKLELMKQKLEHPMDNMVNHWVNVCKPVSRDPYSPHLARSSILMDTVR
jgi:hypothetical protein